MKKAGIFFIVLIIFMSTHAFAQSRIPFLSVNFSPTGRIVDGKYLYRIGASFGIGFNMSDDPAKNIVSDVVIVVNGKRYLYSDLDFEMYNQYLGRLRQEPYVFVDEGEILQIEILGLAPKPMTTSIQVPRKMPSVTVSPSFDPDALNTHEEYTFTWDDIDADAYTYLVYNPRGGEGNSVETNKLIVGSRLLRNDKGILETIGFAINSENKKKLETTGCIVQIFVEGPAPWDLMHTSLGYNARRE